MGFISTALGIAEKDLKTELRNAHEIASVLAFSLGSLLIYSLALTIANVDASEAGGAAIWIILYFTSVLIFTTTFAREADRGTLGGLKTLPCSPLAILFGKVIYAVTMFFVVELLLLLLSGVFILGFTISGRFSELLLVFSLGGICLATAGSFVSSLVMFSEGKPLLLPFLLLPVCMPALIPLVLATTKIISGLNSSIATELELLLAFLLGLMGITGSTFRYILEE